VPGYMTGHLPPTRTSAVRPPPEENHQYHHGHLFPVRVRVSSCRVGVNVIGNRVRIIGVMGYGYGIELDGRFWLAWVISHLVLGTMVIWVYG